jgi:hypothetical protein
MLTNSTLYSVNSRQMYAQKYRAYTTFWNTLRVIPRRTRQSLDYYVIVLDVRHFGWTSTAFWPYKYPLTPSPISHQIRPLTPLFVPRLLVDRFVSVCEVS